MELWNDFEGKVVDDRFRLGRLLAPKGRSAFFLASTLSGEPIMMRVIESLNDEEEILARWRVVEGIHEENLQRIAASGKTVLDGTHLVYAVLEPTEASLDEVLRERPLNAEETRQMAAAVVAGLESLHRAGMVHEHVDAGNVLARGETVKLRSDCVREAPEGAEGEALRRKDAHDLAVLVGYALTQRRDAAQGTLPRQFEDLVRNGTNGTWGMKEMSALLRPAAATALPPVNAGAGAKGTAGPVLLSGLTGVAAGGAGSAGGGAVGNGAAARAGRPATALVSTGTPAGRETSPVPPAVGPSGPVPPAVLPGVPRSKEAARAGGDATSAAARSTSPAAVASALLDEEGASAEPERAGVGVGRAVLEPEEAPHRFSATPWVAAGIAALVLLLLIWHFAGRGAKTRTAVAPETAPTMSGAVAPAAAKPSAGGAGHETPATGRAGARQAEAGGSGSSGSSGSSESTGTASPVAAGAGTWRVITYTYVHREQAQHKADAIAAQHPELRPEVFAPGGRGTFLVALGGAMTKREAIGLRARALRDGMPRDTFARNYRGR